MWAKIGIASSAPTTAIGHDRRPRAHRGLHEAAAAEAAQLVAVLVELLRALAALGEDEHELLLVVQQAVDVGRVGGHAADLGHEHAEARIALEEVLDGEVQRPRAGVLLLDRLERSSRRRAAARRRGWRPAARRRWSGRSRSPRPRSGTSSGRASRRPCCRSAPSIALRAAPVGDLALGLDRRAGARAARRRAPGGLACGRSSAARPRSSGSSARASSGQSAAQTMSSSSQISRFQGCSSVAARDPGVDGGRAG